MSQTKSSKLREHANVSKSAKAMNSRTLTGTSKRGECEFVYTVDAAKRTEQRRIQKFLTMIDLKMCDAVYSSLITSIKECHRQLRRRATEKPLLKSRILLDDNRRTLIAEPNRVDVKVLSILRVPTESKDCNLQEGIAKVMDSFLQTAVSLDRIFGREDITQFVSEIDDLRDPSNSEDVLHVEDHERLVEGVMQTIDEAFQSESVFRDSLLPLYHEIEQTKETDFEEIVNRYNTDMFWRDGDKLLELRSLLGQLRTQAARIRDIQDIRCIELLEISTVDLKNDLAPCSQRSLERLNILIPSMASSLLKRLGDDLHEALSRLQAMDISAKDFVAKLKHLRLVEEKDEDLKKRYQEIQQLYELIAEYQLEITELDKASVLDLANEYESLREAVLSVRDSIPSKTLQYRLELEADMEQLVAIAAELNESADQDEYLSMDSAFEDVVPDLQILKTKINNVRGKAKEAIELQKFLKLAQSDLHNISTVCASIEMRLALWIEERDFTLATESWKSTSFLEVDVNKMDDYVMKMSNSVTQMERALPPNDKLKELKSQVDYFKKILPVVSNLRNPTLKERHWNKINKAVELPINGIDITLGELLDTGIPNWAAYIAQVATEASQEVALEQSLQKVVDKWESTEFTLLNYKESRDVFILTEVEDIVALVDDSLLAISAIYASRYAEGIREKVDKVDKRLNLFSETLEEWLNCQKNWIYLESIFSAPDIQRQLSSESKAFQAVDSDFKKVMNKTRERPNALQRGTTAGKTVPKFLSSRCNRVAGIVP